MSRPLVDDVGEEQECDETVFIESRTSKPVRPEDIQLQVDNERERMVARYQGGTAVSLGDQEQNPCTTLARFAESLANSQDLEKSQLLQNVLAPSTTHDGRVTALSSVQNSVVSDKLIVNINKFPKTEYQQGAPCAEDSPLSLLKESTKRKLKKHQGKKYYETNATKDARKILVNGMVFIEGPCKSGKSSLALHLLSTFGDFTPLQINDSIDLKTLVNILQKQEEENSEETDNKAKTNRKVNNDRFIVLIDDVLKYPDMHIYMQEVMELVNDGSIHLILTSSSSYIVKKEKKTQSGFSCILREANRINLLKYPLQENDRYELFKCSENRLRWLKQNAEGTQEALVQKIALIADYPWYMQVLQEMESLKFNTEKEILDFFKQPTPVLEKVLWDMFNESKEYFFALVNVMKEGFMLYRPSRCPQSPVNDNCEKLSRYYGSDVASVTRIQSAAKDMEGEYLLLHDNKFVFIHQSLIEPVCRILLVDCPDLGIEWCPLSVINTMTKTRNSSNSDDPSKVEITAEDEALLRQRFQTESNLMEVLKHPGFSDPSFFPECIKGLFITQDQYRDILIQSVTLQQLPLTMEIISYCRRLEDEGHHILVPALEKACEVGNYGAFSELSSAGVKPNSSCMKACHRGRDRRIISKILDFFSKHSALLSNDIMCERATLVAEIGHSGMLKTFFSQLQGRADRQQIMEMTLEKILTLGDIDKYYFTIGELEKSSLNYDRLIVAASRGGNPGLLKNLLELLAEHSEGTQNKKDVLVKAFAEACIANMCQIVKVLLIEDPDLIRLRFPEDKTAVHLAAGTAYNQKPNTLTWLLSKRELNWKGSDCTGSTALHIGSFMGNIETVDALLKAECDPFCKDEEDNTALHVHIDGKFLNKPVVEMLLGKDKRLRQQGYYEQLEVGKKMSDVLNIQNKNGDTPLHLLCRKMEVIHIPILHLLLEEKHSVNLTNGAQKTPLQELIMSRRCPEAVTALLESGARIDVIGKDGQTILHTACLNGSDDIIKKIILNKSFLRKKDEILACADSEGRTPLHCYVSTLGKEKIVRDLCNDQSINALDVKGQTALHIAVGVPGNIEAVKALTGEATKCKAGNMNIALHIICRHSHPGSTDLAELLLNKGARVNDSDNNHLTPLHFAAGSQGPEGHALIEMLLRRKADIWKKDVDGMTPIHRCCLTCSDESSKILKILLHHLQIQNQLEKALAVEDKYGDRPLHKVGSSTGQNKREVAQLLIDAGADVAFCNRDEDTVLDISRRSKNIDVIQLIIETVLTSACRDKLKLQHAERILARELSPILISEERLRQLMIPVLQTDGQYTISVLDMLIGRGADIKRETEDGCTVIHLAVSTVGEYTEEIICYLISKGADISVKNETGETALHRVCIGQGQFCSSMIKFLTKRGLSVNDKDSMGNTPLHKLLEKLNPHYQACMEELLMLQADICAPNNQGKTPCDLAKQHGPEVIRELFISYCTKVRTLNRKPLESMLSCGVNINFQDEDGNTVLHRICMKRVSHICNNVRLLLKLGANKRLCNRKELSAFDVACDTGLDEDVRELTVIEMPEELDTDGATPSPTTPRSLPCPEWFQRSPSMEGWEYDLRRGMAGIRNAAGMQHFDSQMDDFERQARQRLNSHFNRYM